MGSPWRDKISLAILELQEKGEIQMLYNKWWKGPKDQCIADKSRQSNKANALGVNNIGGVFVFLLCGLAFAVLIAILEFFHKSRKHQKEFIFIENTQKNNSNYFDIENCVMNHLNDIEMDGNYTQKRQSLFTDMTDELCLALKCQGSRQRAVFKNQCQNCHFIRKQYQQERNKMCEQLSHSNIMETSLSTLPLPLPSPNQSSQPSSSKICNVHTNQNDQPINLPDIRNSSQF